jgi:hypothetical protein
VLFLCNYILAETRQSFLCCTQEAGTLPQKAMMELSMLCNRMRFMTLLLGLTALSGCDVPLESQGINFGAPTQPMPADMQSAMAIGTNAARATAKVDYCTANAAPAASEAAMKTQITDMITSMMSPSGSGSAPLVEGGVAINIAKMIGQAAFNGYKTGRAMAGMREQDTNDSDLQPGTIGPFGLRNFGRNLHNRYMHPAMQSAMTGADTADQTNSTPFWRGLGDYYESYFDGEFVDRFGNKLAKPGLGTSTKDGASQTATVTDTDIAGAVAVFIEYVADRVVSTPVWVSETDDTGAMAKDNALYYYPGGTTDEPTAASLGFTKALLLDGEPASKQLPGEPTARTPAPPEGLGITKLKARVIRYISDAAGTEADVLGGAVAGTFGGVGVAFGPFGKLSFGDNQTLQTLLKSALAHAFTRAAEQVGCEIISRISVPDIPTDEAKMPGSDKQAFAAAMMRQGREIPPGKMREMMAREKMFDLHNEIVHLSRMKISE